MFLRFVTGIIMTKRAILALGTGTIDKETTEDLLALSSGHVGKRFR